MAILPVYTASKLHAARINLKHLAQQYVKERGFWPKVGVVCKKFRGRTRPTLRTPLHEILDPPLVKHVRQASPS